MFVSQENWLTVRFPDHPPALKLVKPEGIEGADDAALHIVEVPRVLREELTGPRGVDGHEQRPNEGDRQVGEFLDNCHFFPPRGSRSARIARPHINIIAQITLKIKRETKLSQKPAAPHLFVRVL